jgi:hypothetical protein
MFGGLILGWWDSICGAVCQMTGSGNSVCWGLRFPAFGSARAECIRAYKAKNFRAKNLGFEFRRTRGEKPYKAFCPAGALSGWPGARSNVRACERARARTHVRAACTRTHARARARARARGQARRVCRVCVPASRRAWEQNSADNSAGRDPPGAIRRARSGPVQFGRGRARGKRHWLADTGREGHRRPSRGVFGFLAVGRPKTLKAVSRASVRLLGAQTEAPALNAGALAGLDEWLKPFTNRLGRNI